MRLPDPFTHPHLEGLGFETCTLTDNDPIIRDELPNGTVQENKSAAQYYSMDVRYPDLFPEEYSVLDAFILEYKRTGGYIEIVIPQYETFRVRGNTALTSIPAGLKASTVIINQANLLTGTPEPGDLFKLSTHPKVYKITTVTKTANVWTLTVYPDLRITTNGTEKPIFTGITFRTKLMNGDSLGATMSADGVYTGTSLTLRES